MRIQTRFCIIFIAVILVTGVVTISVTRFFSKNILERQIHNHLTTTAESRAQDVETVLLLNTERVNAMRTSFIIKNLLTANTKDSDYPAKLEDANARLDSMMKSGHNIFKISILDRNGMVVSSTDEGFIGTDKSTEHVFLLGRKGFYIRDAGICETSKKPSISMTAPITEGNELLGVMSVGLTMDEVYDITTDRTGLGETGGIYLINKEGYMITPSRFRDDTFLKQKVDTVNARHCLTREPKAVMVYDDFRGVKVLGTNAFIKEMNWCLIVEMSEEEALAPVNELTKLLLSILAFLSVASIIVSIRLSQVITKPILELHKGTEEIMKGNLDYTVGTKARNEIGELSRAFDKMNANLKESRVKLEEYNKTLEKRVSERTEELNKRVKELRDARAAALNLLEDMNEMNKKLEESYQRLRESDKVKDEFMNIAAHELKTPLVPIIGYVNMLKDGSLGEVTEEERNSLEIISRNVERLKKLIDDILDISKLESGAMKFEMRDTQITEVIKNSVQDMQSYVRGRGLTLKTRIQPDLPPIQGDKNRMMQVLTDLIDNAIKFTEKGGIVIEAKRERDNIQVTVKDTGIGISRENIDKLFIKFYQIDSSLSRKYGGTGLGLAICKKIVEAHGGEIWVESGPGKGSIFHFTLPIKK